MGARYLCKQSRRKGRVGNVAALNGIDWLEVLDQEAPSKEWRQRALVVRCFQPVGTSLAVEIEGGVRISPVKVLRAFPLSAPPPGLTPKEQAVVAAIHEPRPERVVVVLTDTAGDFSTYRLKITGPPQGTPGYFDPRFAEIEFSFKVECPSDFDCKAAARADREQFVEPAMDYLAKEYSSFRRLMLDRLSATMPDWTERNPADAVMAVVEMLAYVGDHLSYYQDAVATEAYLGTARRRISVRRHARLVDYPMHDGANARVWIAFEVEGPGPVPLASGARIVPRGNAPAIMSSDEFEAGRDGFAVVFETVTGAVLQSAHNAMRIYTWGDEECCLPRGSTRATVRWEPGMALAEGGFVLFEEVRSPVDGEEANADRTRRHAVRLTKVHPPAEDPLDATAIQEIEWDERDALPFSLCLSATVKQHDGTVRLETDLTIARGNVVLADHGATVKGEQLPAVPARVLYRPKPERTPLTFAVPIAAAAPAAAIAGGSDPRFALPAIKLQETPAGREWTPRRDLLSSGPFANEFVAEIDAAGRAQIRFGDDLHGRKPEAGAAFTATYRVGNGAAGNVGAEVLTRVESDEARIVRVRNPLPARGGIDPETEAEVKLLAPQAFRTQERAVTEADYAEKAERHSEVQKASAVFRWTGSWYTVFVIVDRKGGFPVDETFRGRIRAHLEPFRMAGHDLEVMGPVFVPVDLAVSVCARAGYFNSEVKREVIDALGRFFHPDNFTFGQPVYASEIYRVVLEARGVESASIEKFERLGRTPAGELANERLVPGPLEIVRLDNNPSFPENGRLDVTVQGGL